MSPAGVHSSRSSSIGGGIAGSLRKKTSSRRRITVSVGAVVVAFAAAACAVLAFEARALIGVRGGDVVASARAASSGRERPKTNDSAAAAAAAAATAAAAFPHESGGDGGDGEGSASPVEDDASGGIPECPGSPWKEDENMIGTCPGTVTKYEGSSSSLDGGGGASPPIRDAASCARACCESSKCVTWQFRRDVGCLHGPDVRLGMEKDGVSAWCSDHPPYRWKGQYVLERRGGKVANDRRSVACNVETWNPREVEGQCFGLGDVRKGRASESAERCMEACCEDETCGAWQWQEEKGCFYNKRMHGCQDANDPVAFEPFVGRRKFLPSRKYVDKSGMPWKQMLKQ